MTEHSLSPVPVFSDAGAQDNAVVVREAQEWIEEVTGRTFGTSFRESLKDGVLLCELMMKINPGSISKINRLKSPIAHLDNIQQFLNACQNLGLKEAQLFDIMDLQSTTTKKTGVKRGDADRKIRSVCVTLYWLGRTVAEMGQYSGPQLDLSAFKSLVQEIQYSDDDESNGSPIDEAPDHYQLDLGNHVSSPELPPATTLENGMGLTFEQEQTADQLLADIQSAVDEMLQDFQSGYIPEDMPDTIEDKPPTNLPDRLGVSVHMISRNGGFGFQVVGGIDANYHPEVELVLPGSAAEDAGIKAGDEIVSVNKQDVTRMPHSELVALIKKAGAEGSVLIGLMRTTSEPTSRRTHTTLDVDNQWAREKEEREKQARKIALLYPPKTAENDHPSPSSRPPPTSSLGGQPLPPLVEHQEEAMLEQIIEMLEKSPPPESPVPFPTHSLVTPTHTAPVTATHPTAAEVPDDLESIERDLQEIVLMELTATAEQQKLQNGDSTDGDRVETVQQANDDEQIEELLQYGNEASLTSQSPDKENFDLDFDLPPPLIESPPPPMPTTEAPKRPVKKASPPPVKAKPPKQRPASFVQATALPPMESETIERAKSATPTKPRFTPPPPPTSPRPISPTPTPTSPPLTTPPLTSPPPTSPPPTSPPHISPPPISPSPTSPPPTSPPRISSPPIFPPPTSSPPVSSPPISPPPTSSPPTSTSPPPTSPSPTSQPESQPPPAIFSTPTSNLSVVKEVGPVTPDDVEIVGDIKIHRVQRTRWTPKGSSTETVASPVHTTEEQYRQRYQQHFTQLWAKATTPTTKQNGFPEPAQQNTMPRTTLPTSQIRNSPRSHNGDRRHTQPAGMASWQSPLGKNDKMFSASAKVLSHPQWSTRTNWKSQEELRIQKTLPSPSGPTEQWKQTTIRQQSMPASSYQYKAQSLPRGNMNNWRVNRSSTWSRGQRPTDGQQSAFAIKPSNPYDLCSRCHKQLGTETVMSIPNVKVQYHVSCFVCRVCRSPLVKSPRNTPVLIKGMHPHCRFCGSNDEGVLTTEC